MFSQLGKAKTPVAEGKGSELGRRLRSVVKPNPGNDRIVEMDTASRLAQNSGASAGLFWGKTESLARLGGDEDLLRELCHIFVEEYPKLLQKLRQAIAEGDPDGLKRAAHSLKGELGYLGAKVAEQASRELEEMGHEKNLAPAAGVFALLERELGALRSAIEQSMGAAR